MTVQPPHPPYIPAKYHGGAQKPRALVIHGTVSPCVPGGARNVARYFATEAKMTSAHYVVDPAESIQCVYDHVVAYHCGYNEGSIALELCDPQTGRADRWFDAYHLAMLDRAADLAARLCVVYDIDTTRPSVAALKSQGPHGIYGHNDSRLAFGHTTHSDPGPDFPWDDFLRDVADKAKALRKGAKPKPVPKPKPRPEGVPHLERVATMNEKGTLSPIVASQDLTNVLDLADIIGLQEWGPDRQHVLDQQAAWSFAKPERVAPPIGVRKARYVIERATTVTLAKGRKVNANGGRANLPDVVAMLAWIREPATGDELAVLNWHLPRGVQDGRWYDRIWGVLSPRARMHREARRKGRDVMREQAKRADRVYLVGDVNFDQMRLRYFTSCWQHRGAVPNTLGRRTVDIVYSEQRVDSVRTVKTRSDHDAVVATYRLGGTSPMTYAKALVGGAIAALTSIQASLPDGLTASEWVGAAIAGLVGLGLVAAVPNKKKP